ncbi:unnamed protein product [Microthlaspi erraticum]|uniref:X8 domain-containing protein n=1 Tax=Microthlaspi erraticum TaxID=1685480 RepID=A0A6D2HHB3_9BRAS|nr:unnamed protein product [Microthlaspi erraticum]
MSQSTTLLLVLLLSVVAINHLPVVSCNRQWCMAMWTASNEQLQANIDYCCSNGVDCTPIQPGGICYNPNTLLDHASYAMNAYYQSHGRIEDSCDFNRTGCWVFVDPSHDTCIYFT